MSSGFISESEILEARRRRQEEWEKVRTEDQPQGKCRPYPTIIIIPLGRSHKIVLQLFLSVSYIRTISVNVLNIF